MYYEDGKEAEEFRLLHVYHSNKRASNREGKATNRRKRTKTAKATPDAMTPPRSLTSTVTYATSPLSTSSVEFRSPTVSHDTESTATAALECPVSVVATEQTSIHSEFWPAEQPIVTPINDILPRTPTRDDHDDDMSSLQSQSVSGYGGYNLSPFRRSNLEGGFGINICNSPLQRTGEYRSILPDEKDGLLDYVPPPDDLRSILTEPIMSYDDGDTNDGASCISGLASLQDKTEDAKLTEPEDTLAEWERKLAGDSLMDAFDDVEFPEQLSIPLFEAL